MELTEQLMAIGILVDFLFGVMIGLVLSVSYASRLEDHRYSLLTTAPHPICDGARIFQGVYVRGGDSQARPGTGRRGARRVPGGHDPGRQRKVPNR
jgi:hypothetical protein